MWAKQKKSGFTIVELLIVIVVIGILATITIVVYNGIQQRARDSKRSSDLASVQKLLEYYHSDFGAYPKCGSTGPNSGNLLSSGTVDQCLADDLVPNYTNALPKDPTNSGSYIYRYAAGYKKIGATTFNSSQTDNFILGVKQETSSGPYYSGWGPTDLTLLLGSSN